MSSRSHALAAACIENIFTVSQPMLKQSHDKFPSCLIRLLHQLALPVDHVEDLETKSFQSGRRYLQATYDRRYIPKVCIDDLCIQDEIICQEDQLSPSELRRRGLGHLLLGRLLPTDLKSHRQDAARREQWTPSLQTKNSRAACAKG